MEKESKIEVFENLLVAAEDDNNSHNLKKQLIEYLAIGGDINDGSHSTVGLTVLMVSAAEGAIKNLSFLIEMGANVNAIDQDGWTPLMFAAMNHRVECVRMLLEKGGEVNAVDNDGTTPAMWAVWSKDLRTLMEIMNHGGSLSIKDKAGKSAIDYAKMEDGSLEIRGYLEALGEMTDIGGCIDDGKKRMIRRV